MDTLIEEKADAEEVIVWHDRSGGTRPLHQENGRCVFPRLSRLRGDLKT